MGLEEQDVPSEKQRPVVDEVALRAAGITEKELSIILAFGKSEEWIVLKKLLKFYNFQSMIALRSHSTTLEWMRHHQGRIGQMNELANFIEVDLAEWYNARTRSKGAR